MGEHFAAAMRIIFWVIGFFFVLGLLSAFYLGTLWP